MERSTLPPGHRVLTHVAAALLLASASVSSAQTDPATNAAAYAWGDNTSGQLGSNAGYYSAVPVAVSDLTGGVTAVAAGNSHSLAVQNGAAYTWGGNDNGQLGNGTSGITANSDVPVAVSGLGSGVTAIAGGSLHSLAVQNGRVFAWGGNGDGQLGNGTTTNSSVPVAVDPADLTNITAVAAGIASSYAFSADGSLWVWGNNDIGELGLGDTTSRLTPQHLLPPAGYRYTAITAPSGGDHAVAVLAPVVHRFFDSEVALSNGVYYLAFPASGNYFGYYSYLSDPKYIYHFDLGYEYVFDAADGKAGVYFYDFKSSTFFYTSPGFPFPYLYDFALKTVLYYYPDPENAGRYNTNGVRYFYRFDTGQIITK